MKNLLFCSYLILIFFFSELSLAQEQAVCRVYNRQGNSISTGSGTLVDVRKSVSGKGNVGLIITCKHIFENSQRKIEVGEVSLDFVNSRKTYKGVFLKAHKKYDLAAIEILNPEIEPVQIVEFNRDENYKLGGYGSKGIFKLSNCRFNSRAGNEDTYIFSASVRSGDSGGPVFNSAGNLAGVIWGCLEGKTYVTSGPVFTQYIQQFGVPTLPGTCINGFCKPSSRPYTIVPVNPSNGRCRDGKCPTGGCPKSRPPKKKPERSICPNCSECSKRLEKLEQKVNSIALQRGPKGDKGDKGDKESIDLEKIADKILSRLPSITVRYLQGDGSVFDSETVHLGDTLDIAPFKVERFFNGTSIAEAHVPIGGELLLWEKDK